MPVDRGKWIHQIRIQKPVIVQDPATGTTKTRWVDVTKDPIFAGIEYLSVREFIASNSMQSQIVARIQINYREGLHATMRILHGKKVYNPAGWLPDNESGREWMTAPCTQGVSASGD